MDYISLGLKFGKLSKRTKTEGIVLHHPATVTYSPTQIHNQHLSQGWAGAGYHVYVRKDGRVYKLRPIDTVGAHAKGSNNNTIGVCVEGMFHPAKGGKYDTKMTQIQYNAVAGVIKDLLKKYPSIKWIKGHREMPGAMTSCPGMYFPLEDFKKLIGGYSVADYNRYILYGKTLKKGDKGTLVGQLQQALTALGYGALLEPYGVDESFGSATEKAVETFQKANRLEVDGRVGPATQKALKELLEAQQEADYKALYNEAIKKLDVSNKKLADIKKIIGG